MQTGMSMFGTLQDRRDRQREIEIRQQRADTEEEWRISQEADREIDNLQRSGERRVGMLERGWTETEPEAPGSGTGAGSQPSSPYPAWYMEEKAAIEREASELYPGSGVAQQKDPRTGQTMYLPVRQKHIQSRMDELNTRQRAEAKAKVDRETKFEDFTREQEVRFGHSKALATHRDGLGGKDGGGKMTGSAMGDEIYDEFSGEVSRLNTIVDDRSAAATGMRADASARDRMNDVSGMKKSMAKAGQLQHETAGATGFRDQRVRGGPHGYVRARADQSLDAEAQGISSQVAPYLNDPSLSPQDRQALLDEYQGAMDGISTRNRERFGVQSPLGRNLRR